MHYIYTTPKIIQPTDPMYKTISHPSSINQYTKKYTKKSIPPLLQPISPMHPIQQPQTPIIQIKLLMMQIMHPRLPPKEIKPTMHSRRHKQLIPQKRPKSQHMTPQQLRRQGDRQRISEDLFDGVGELRGEGDGGRELVVLFVDADVEVGTVEEAVGVVEEGFASEEAEEEVAG